MDIEQRLYAAARAVSARAYAPYSKFYVGAALLGASGAIYTGANVENIAYPQGWCAETSALAHLIVAGELRVQAVAVYAHSQQAVVPCGGCRQKLAEFADPDCPIYSCNSEGVSNCWRLVELLPQAFNSF